MFYVLLLLFGCTGLAFLSVNKQYIDVDNSEKQISKQGFGLYTIAFIALLITLVCFSGLRTFSNDTTSYMTTYDEDIPDQLTEIKNIDWSIGNNPLFVLFQILLKSVFGANAQMFIFVSSLITVASMVIFIKKHSEIFGFSIYIFIAFGVYAFTFAAMKQTLATAIAIWAVPLFLNRKIVRAIFLIIISMLIHPYVIVLFAFFFLHKNVWDKRAFIIIALTIVSGFAFTSVIESALNFTSMIGEDYSMSSFEGNGINVFRILVYWITPILSFVFRNEIREKNNQFLNICVNLSFVSACFVLLAMFGGAIALGRLANYLDIFTCICLPAVISCGLSNSELKKPVTFLAYIGFFIFYLVYYNKFMPSFFGDMFVDYYAHVPITAIFGG